MGVIRNIFSVNVTLHNLWSHISYFSEKSALRSILRDKAHIFYRVSVIAMKPTSITITWFIWNRIFRCFLSNLIVKLAWSFGVISIVRINVSIICFKLCISYVWMMSLVYFFINLIVDFIVRNCFKINIILGAFYWLPTSLFFLTIVIIPIYVYNVSSRVISGWDRRWFLRIWNQISLLRMNFLCLLSYN